MVSSDIIHMKREQDVSIGLWNHWMYRPLLLVTTPLLWSVGVLDFCAGRDKPRKLGRGTIVCYTLFGQGFHEEDDTVFTAFQPGSVLSLTAEHLHTFACDKPTRFLIVASELSLDVSLTPIPIAPGHHINTTAAGFYILRGSVEVQTDSNLPRTAIGRATVFSVSSLTDYTIYNSDPKETTLISIGVQATARQETTGAAFV